MFNEINNETSQRKRLIEVIYRCNTNALYGSQTLIKKFSYRLTTIPVQINPTYVNGIGICWKETSVTTVTMAT